MNIWIMQTGEALQCDNSNVRPMRAINLSNELLKKGHKVKIYSSDFFHQIKTHRNNQDTLIQQSANLEIQLIHSIGYKSHIGIARLIDHIQLAYKLKKMLKQVKEKPDLIFIGYPPIEIAYVISSWARKNQIPSIIDVKDLWPEIFLDYFPKFLKPLGYLIFSPYYFFGKKAIKNSSYICGMSESYVQWARDFVNESNKPYIIARLSPPNSIDYFNDKKSKIKELSEIGLHKDKPIVIFAGSFSKAFNFEDIFKVSKTLKDFQFVMCGDGPQKEYLVNLTKDSPNIIYTGWVSKEVLDYLSTIAIATIAPYRNIKNFQLNIPNKIIDSLAYGLPILTPLRGEVSKLISRYDVGYIYNSTQELADHINEIYINQTLRNSYKNNCKNLYSQEFDFDKVYTGLIEEIQEIILREKIINK